MNHDYPPFFNAAKVGTIKHCFVTWRVLLVPVTLFNLSI